MSENAYEEVQLVARSVEKMKLDKTPPDPPPRNIVLKPVKSNIYRWGGGGLSLGGQSSHLYFTVLAVRGTRASSPATSWRR